MKYTKTDKERNKQIEYNRHLRKRAVFCPKCNQVFYLRRALRVRKCNKIGCGYEFND